MAKKTLPVRPGHGGRPDIYNPKVHYQLIETYFSLGYIDKEVCEQIGITERTLYYWYKSHPELLQAKKAKKIPNKMVEAAIYKNAIGHYKEEKEIVGEVDASGKFTGKRMAKISTKYIAPNVVAGIFYLKNRDPERWKDKQEIDLRALFVDLKVPLEPEEEERIEAELNKTITSAKLLKKIKSDISK